MPSHFLAVFAGTTPPPGLDLYGSPRRRNVFEDVDFQEMERQCSNTLDDFKSPRKARTTFNHGQYGFSMEVGPNCHYADRDGVSVCFAGEVAAWPGVDVVSIQHDAFIRGESADAAHNDAAWLLDFYNTFSDFAGRDVTDTALNSLANVKGQFAFVMYDKNQRRLLAARDVNGEQEMYWGAAPDGRLIFGSNPDDLVSCNPTATPFPAGSMYASEDARRAVNPGERGWVMAGEQWPGQLFAFVRRSLPPRHGALPAWRDVKAVPRVNSQGALCGSVYRVASDVNVAGLTSA